MKQDEYDALEITFFAVVGLLAFVNCLQEDGFLIGVLCGAGGAFLAWGYYSIARSILEGVIEEEKGRAVARKLVEVVGLGVAMALLVPMIVGG